MFLARLNVHNSSFPVMIDRNFPTILMDLIAHLNRVYDSFSIKTRVILKKPSAREKLQRKTTPSNWAFCSVNLHSAA